jgi:hypothetical protein
VDNWIAVRLGVNKSLERGSGNHLGFSDGRYEKSGQTNGAVGEKGDYTILMAAAYGGFCFSLWEVDYIKSKLGLWFENVTRRGDSGVKRVKSDHGLAGSLGFGTVVLQNTVLEGEASVIDKDIILLAWVLT